MADEKSGKSKGGKARSESLTPERRSEIARNAALAKAEIRNLPKVTHGSSDHPLKIGDAEIPCYVLEDGTRVLSQRGLIAGLGMSRGSRQQGGDRMVTFLESKGVKPFVSEDLLAAITKPIRFLSGNNAAVVTFGYPATVLADICEAVLAARKVGALHYQQVHIAEQCEVLVRGFARVGIIALVDEATGYQKDRARDALAQILEAFVAKELQPYVRTFPPDYYEHLFRLRGLKYPPENANYRPQYFGKLTNDIVYRRLAPGLLAELKKENNRDSKKGHLHRRLTPETGHAKLREHLSSVTTAMKLSKDYPDFIEKLNMLHPRYGDTLTLDLDKEDV
ncbi:MULTISPECIES: P63C domain-containing protein [unclassified Pseudomonas]|uniref:P63C domain-containing protein n=1 Tax=unclassified Pseudomonas TaxID=196821 RepID=UPI000A1FCF68|nr:MULTISPECIES: P63C domain-containing protein [unclassified Pseudomonas]